MRYVYRKIIFYVVALWVAITLNFAIPRMMPGNPAETIFASHAQQLQSNPHALAAIEAALGLSNDPMSLQYWHYLVNLAHFDFGVSFSEFPTRVSTIIVQSLPWTLFLVGIASVLAWVLGTGFGILTAWRRGGLLDSTLPGLTIFTHSLPNFWLGLILLYVLAFILGWFPTSHAYDVGLQPGLTLHFVGSVLYHAVLPALTLIIVTVGGWLLGMRNVMINTLAEDYITMAQAKGLSDRRVMFGYAARNALLPQITGLAMSLGFLVGGQVLIEDVFSYPGVGYVLANAVGQEDYPLIQALLLIIVVCMLVANLAVDLLYARLDPRVRTT
jgi:peptide/nickel transport system permease protein